MSEEEIVVKVWDWMREKRRVVLTIPTLHNVVTEANKKGLCGQTLVLEEDGSLIDEDELLLHFKDKVFLLLETNQAWTPKAEKLYYIEKKTDTISKDVSFPSSTNVSQTDELDCFIEYPSTSETSHTQLLSTAPSTSNELQMLSTISNYSEQSNSTNESNSTCSLPTTLSVSSGTFSDNDESIGKIQMNKLFENFEIPWNKFPSSIMDICRKNENLPPNLLKRVIQTIVEEMRYISKYITIDVFRNVAHKLITTYPNTFGYKDMEGNLMSPRNSPLITSMMQRNHYLNRPEKSKNKSNIPLKMRRFSKNFENTCKNWDPDDNKNADKEAITQKQETLKRFSKQVTFTKDEYNEIQSLMDECYIQQRKFFNNLTKAPSFRSIKDNWPLLLRKEFVFRHFESLTEKKISHVTSTFVEKVQKIIKFAENKKPRIIHTINKTRSKEILIALDFLCHYFQENLDFLCKTYDIGTQLSDIEVPTSSPWCAIFETSDEQSTIYVFIEREIANSTSKDIQEGLQQEFCFYFILNKTYPQEASQTLDFIQRYFFEIHTDITRGKKKNTNAVAKVLRLMTAISQEPMSS